MGEQFREVYPILIVLVLINLINMPLTSSFLLATGKHGSAAKLRLLGALLNVIFSCLLVIPYGMMGVALGTIAASLINSTLLPWLSCRHVGTSGFQFVLRSLLPPLISGLPVAGILMYLKQAGFGDVLIEFLGACALAEFVFLLAFLGVFERREAIRLIASLKARKS